MTPSTTMTTSPMGPPITQGIPITHINHPKSNTLKNLFLDVFFVNKAVFTQTFIIHIYI